jgi:hypothetical protein
MKCLKCKLTIGKNDIGFHYHDIVVCNDCHNRTKEDVMYTEKTMATFEKEFNRNRNQEIKQDSGKPRWELVPMKALEGIALVMQDAIEPTELFPDGRYEVHSWQKVDPKRYLAALVRHITELQAGQERTDDTGMRIIDAILTNAMFLSWFLQNGYDIKKLVPEGEWDVPDFMHPDAQEAQDVVPMEAEPFQRDGDNWTCLDCGVMGRIITQPCSSCGSGDCVKTEDVPNIPEEILLRIKEGGLC